MYEATPVFIPVDITEDVVELVVQKLSGSIGPSGTDLEDLQGWLLKFWDHSRKLCVIVKYFVDCLAQKKPPWDSYSAFMSSRLIVLNKLLRVRLLGVGEMWCCLFAKCVLKVTEYDSTHACRDDQL